MGEWGKAVETLRACDVRAGVAVGSSGSVPVLTGRRSLGTQTTPAPGTMAVSGGLNANRLGDVLAWWAPTTTDANNRLQVAEGKAK